jgi:hypothetical protein
MGIFKWKLFGKGEAEEIASTSKEGIIEGRGLPVRNYFPALHDERASKRNETEFYRWPSPWPWFWLMRRFTVHCF